MVLIAKPPEHRTPSAYESAQDKIASTETVQHKGAEIEFITMEPDFPTMLDEFKHFTNGKTFSEVLSRADNAIPNDAGTSSAVKRSNNGHYIW